MSKNTPVVVNEGKETVNKKKHSRRTARFVDHDKSKNESTRSMTTKSSKPKKEMKRTTITTQSMKKRSNR